MLDHLEQATVNSGSQSGYPLWVLGTEPEASARATSAFIFKPSIKPAEL